MHPQILSQQGKLLLLLDGASCLQCCQGNNGRSGCGLEMRHLMSLLKHWVVFKIWCCTIRFGSVNSTSHYAEVRYLLMFCVNADLPCSTLCSPSFHQPPQMQPLSGKSGFLSLGHHFTSGLFIPKSNLHNNPVGCSAIYSNLVSHPVWAILAIDKSPL